MSPKIYRSVDAYLEDLSWQLRVGGRARARIVREVADHLAEAVAVQEAAGQTPQAAVRRATTRFGAPADLAAEFNRDVAVHGVRRAAWVLAVCVGVGLVAAGGALQGWGPVVPWPNEAVFLAVPELLVQVAAVCAGNALLLAVLAPAICRTPLSGQSLRLAARSLALGAAVMLPVAVVSAGDIAGAAWGEGAMQAFVAVAVPMAGWCTVRAASWVEQLDAVETADAESALDVLVACLFVLAARWYWSERLADRVTAHWSQAVDRAPALMSWLELRRHPWRTALTVSVAAGIALKSSDLILKGELDVLAAAIEAAVVFVSYWLLGGILGLRRCVTAP